METTTNPHVWDAFGTLQEHVWDSCEGTLLVGYVWWDTYGTIMKYYWEESLFFDFSELLISGRVVNYAL